MFKTFVTRKITRFLTKKKLGLEKILYIGNLYAKRDWGHAKDYVEMQWKILQQNKADDYVIETGKAHNVKEFINEACRQLNFQIKWVGKGLKERAILMNSKKKNEVLIKVDKKYFRPLEIDYLRGDSSKAHKLLKFKPKYNFKKLINEMIIEDLKLAKSELIIKKSVND